MKDQFTYEVGDTILLYEAEETVCGNCFVEIVHVDLIHAIAHLKCSSESDKKWQMELYSRNGNPNDIREIERNEAIAILGASYECGEYDVFFDAYFGQKYFHKRPQDCEICINDKDGNLIPYQDVKDADCITYCGLQVVDQIRYFKLFGVPADGYDLIPLSDNELKELDLSKEGNYYKGSVVYPKELIQGEWAEVEINGLYWTGEIVHAYGNRAVLKVTPYDESDLEGLDRVEFDELIKWPGAAYLSAFESMSDDKFIVIDLITGETEEQFQYLDVQAEDGTVLTGEICGYKYVGRKIVGRFLSFDGEDSSVVERMFFDRAEDNRLMCQKPTETPLYYFGLADNDRVKILH